MIDIFAAPRAVEYLLLGNMSFYQSDEDFMDLDTDSIDCAEIEREIAALLVEGLNLTVDANEIRPTDPLFGEGLGLDSIDALEMALLLQNQYGVTIKQGDVDNVKIFASLRSLGEFVTANRLK
jgi:acyl carrier protein